MIYMLVWTLRGALTEGQFLHYACTMLCTGTFSATMRRGLAGVLQVSMSNRRPNSRRSLWLQAQRAQQPPRGSSSLELPQARAAMAQRTGRRAPMAPRAPMALPPAPASPSPPCAWTLACRFASARFSVGARSEDAVQKLCMSHMTLPCPMLGVRKTLHGARLPVFFAGLGRYAGMRGLIAEEACLHYDE